jgi:transcriptional regulator with XRE-family HTH domain
MKKELPQNSAFYQQLGENIRKCRKRRKLSQDALAKLVGLTRTSLTNIESGRQHPPLHTFCEIVEQLKVDISELLPPRPTPRAPIDLKKLAGTQVRGEDELAFIQTAIGAEGAKSHGDTKNQNPDDGRRTSR